MSLHTNLNRFLEANGVDARTARAVSGKIRDNVHNKRALSVEEIALAHEFISRAPAAGDRETLQLQSLVEKGASAPQSGKQVADKALSRTIAHKVGSKIAHKVGSKIAAEPRPQPRGDVAGKVFSKIALKLGRGVPGGLLQPADIRQLAHQVARG